ncbi:hypothetical protein PMAYCL1PPCAC_21220 [Pristionchus mayeri]|uniref:C-type lectin domain-containing protein n=1 Tax=Pristionchus mayeri TaxID=1317129 RepID=A0AAN5CVE9_9BILA|nr:hypothetical protein PMAYCL1PPCAC_21220 [Pristionchus mayeri]
MLTIRMVNSFFFFFLLIGGAQAFVFSCNEIKYKLINANLEEPTQYVCLISQDGYTNVDALKNIYAQSDKVSTSFADMLGQCVERPGNAPWRVVADLPLTLDCTQELSLIFTSSPPNPAHVPETPFAYDHFPRELILVRPQTGIRINKKQCSGIGNFSVHTGAGTGVAEYRFPMASWGCADMPDWIVSFENVITVMTDEGMDLSAEIASFRANSEIAVSQYQRMAVMSSGRSDDLQLSGKYTNSVVFNSDATTTMNLKCNSYFENGDYLSLYTNSMKSKSDSLRITSGEFSWSDTSSLFELDYQTIPVAPQDLWDSQDNFVCEFTLGGSTIPVNNPDPYCQCGLDKFGMPDDTWDPTQIWLDIAIILDTSEAMGAVALADASTLIESFFGTEGYDVLNTNTNAKFYTRVGLIAMSDKAEILYNMNMTKGDSVTDHVQIKNGLKQIDVLAAFFAAQNMLKDAQPKRANTRQVIYYMTDSAPTFDPSSPNVFKNSFGIIIVNDFVESDVIEQTSLKELASPGYYSTDLQDNYMDSIQLFCKANCFCRPDNDRVAYTGQNTDPAVKASGGCYHAPPTGVPYDNLKSNCGKGGGIIASVHDAKKADFLNQLVAPTTPKLPYFWIGYTKTDAGWVWEDKSTNPYTHWDVNEPNPNSVSKCAYVDMTNSTLPWGAGNCNTGFVGVCEYKPCSAGNDNC